MSELEQHVTQLKAALEKLEQERSKQIRVSERFSRAARHGRCVCVWTGLSCTSRRLLLTPEEIPNLNLCLRSVYIFLWLMFAHQELQEQHYQEKNHIEHLHEKRVSQNLLLHQQHALTSNIHAARGACSTMCIVLKYCFCLG